MAVKFYESYKIDKNSAVAYKLRLPAQTRRPPIFHVSLLKKYEPEQQGYTEDLPDMVNQGEEEMVEPKEILLTWTISKNGKQKEQSLANWRGIAYRTWENVRYLSKQFPYLNLRTRFLLKGKELLWSELKRNKIELKVGTKVSSQGRK